jgi:hypothetical protein
MPGKSVVLKKILKNVTRQQNICLITKAAKA